MSLESYDPLIKVIKETPHHTIRPSRVASLLSMSHADATELLCTLLRAVGSSATFRFENLCTLKEDEPFDLQDKSSSSSSSSAAKSSSSSMVMTFQFPPDFEKRIQRFQRVTQFRDSLYKFFIILVKISKIVIALGFILSLVVVTFLGIIILIGAFVAMLTQQGRSHGNHPSLLSPHRFRSIILALRDVLWIYAIFGDCGCCEWILGRGQGAVDEYGDGRPHQDPFFRDMAQDLSLLLSVCCLGSNGGFGYYWGIQRLQQRRFMGVDGRRRRQGWSGRGQETSTHTSTEGVTTDIPGVYVWNRGGSWRRRELPEDLDHHDHRGLLNQQPDDNTVRSGFVSVAIEFLFGPLPFWPGPSESDKWKLRECFIVHELSKPNMHGISLERFLPYCDYPPSVDQSVDPKYSSASSDPKLSFAIVLQCLHISSYFGGLPADGKRGNSTLDDNTPHATFVFPELMLEAEGDGLSLNVSNWAIEGNECHQHWTCFLFDYNKNVPASTLPSPFARKTVGTPVNMEVPTYMIECYHSLTRLSPFEFYLCSCLVFLNLIGIIGLQRYLESTTRSIFKTVFVKSVLSIFRMYAWAFLAAPFVRALYILVLNYRISIRNKRRKRWVDQFNSQ